MVRRGWGAWFGGAMIGIMLALVTVGYWYLPHDPTLIQVTKRLQPPSREFLLGSDSMGRDLLSRIMVGGRISLAVGGVTAAIGLAFGTVLGAWSGWRGGWRDQVVMRAADGLYAFPPFLLAVLAVTIFEPGLVTAATAISIGSLPGFMRLARSNVLSLREAQYVEAARALGARSGRILFRHILPNMMRPLLVQMSVTFAAAVLAEASLSYLGVGVQPPTPSWGRMLREAQGFAGIAPWVVLVPGIAVAWTVMGFNILGDGMQR